jgi:xanthosine utilization system XapX-like protein
MQKLSLSLFFGIGAVGVGVVFSLLAVAAAADPAVGAGVAVVFGVIAAAFLAVAHRALRVSSPAAAIAAISAIGGKEVAS